ncbi:MAG: GNAT family N-acetyltransferase, partial [Myxococcales bacterium]|nr:GNAT family N-acetyltransferase [Myxococcales bacterium]
MAVPLEFRTARLELRRLTRDHLDDLVALDADPEVMRFISGGAPNPRSLYETEILARMTGWDDEP